MVLLPQFVYVRDRAGVPLQPAVKEVLPILFCPTLHPAFCYPYCPYATIPRVSL